MSDESTTVFAVVRYDWISHTDEFISHDVCNIDRIFETRKSAEDWARDRQNAHAATSFVVEELEVYR
jgi:hypothetical protein